MNQANSNSKFKQNLVRIIIAILLIITALNLFKPITAYADSTNTKGYNGTGATEGESVGKLFWGGSTTRTALVFYIVNGQTGKVLTAGDVLGPTCDNPTDRVAFLVYNSLAKDYFKSSYIHDANLYTHFGAMKRDANIEIYDNSMPYPVQYNEDTHAWSSNNDAVATWLFSKVGDYEMWQYIIKEGFTNKYRNDLLGEIISEALFKSMESGIVFDSIFGEPIQLEEGEDAFVLCIEPVSTHCVYGTAQWTEDSAQEFINRATEVDNDCVKYLNKYKQQHGTYAGAYRPAVDPTKNRIIRACATGSSAAKGNNNIAEMMGLNPNNSSNANRKWVHQALPYCMTLAYDQLGLGAVTSSTPEFKTAEEYERGDMGYGISMFGKQLQADFISTYDGYSREPAPSEKPVNTPDKNTTGDCTITKIYFDKEIDGATGNIKYTFVKYFTTKDTTGYINLTPEKGKSGYSITKWATTIEPFSDIESYYRSDKYSALVKRFENATYWGTGTGGVQQFHLNNSYYGNQGKRKHLYVVYTKTIRIPAPEIEDYDFEIPESYITKQVYFSDANNTSNTQNTALRFTQNNFKWTSKAHNNCPGHEVLTCTTKEHKHDPETRYEKGSLKCPTQEHSHSDGCLKKRYKCKNCSAQEWYDWNAVSHTSSCALTSTEKADAANYSVSRQVRDEGGNLECTVCSQKSSDKHWVSSIEHADNCKYKDYKTGSIPDSAYKCANAHTHTDWKSKNNAGCYYSSSYTIWKCNNNSRTKCQTTEHTHFHNGKGDDCYTPGIKCTDTWEDQSIALGLKLDNPDAYKTILASSGASLVFDSKNSIESVLQESSIATLIQYSWVKGVRTDKGADTQEGTFDCALILLRGKDKVTLAQWKSVIPLQQTAINKIGTLTNQFYVGNTPHTGDRKTDNYPDVMSNVKFSNNSLDTSTKNKFSKKNAKHIYEWNTLLGKVAYNACTGITKTYVLDAEYTIPKITVKVNVFSDYEGNNGDGASGDATITFYPYVRMYYDTPTARNQSALVLGETQRTFQAHDGADINFTQGTGMLDITSAQWSTHTSAKSKLKALAPGADTNKILPGGAALDLSISEANTRIVQAVTYHVLLPAGSEGYAQVSATGSASVQSDTTARGEHAAFASAVRASVSNLRIKQFKNNNPAQEPNTLVNPISTDSKYYFNQYNNSALQAKDIGTNYSYYTIRTTVAGKIELLDGSGKVMASAGTADALKNSNDTARRIENNTHAISSLYNAVLSHKGTVGKDEKADQWYNEAFDGITVMIATTSIKIGLFNQNPIATISDPKLIPTQSTSQNNGAESIFTAFYSSRYKVVGPDGRTEISATFAGETIRKDLGKLYQSAIFYIPNVTVQDLN